MRRLPSGKDEGGNPSPPHLQPTSPPTPGHLSAMLSWSKIPSRLESKESRLWDNLVFDGIERRDCILDGQRSVKYSKTCVKGVKGRQGLQNPEGVTVPCWSVEKMYRVTVEADIGMEITINKRKEPSEEQGMPSEVTRNSSLAKSPTQPTRSTTCRKE